MIFHGIFNQYWRLVQVVILPARYVRWLLLLAVVSVALGAVLTFFDLNIVLIIGSGLSLVFLLVVGMLVPGQMLALRSSKQFQYMADLRHKLFLIVLVFWWLAGLTLTVTLVCIDHAMFPFYPTFAVATMLLSFVAALFAIVGSYVQVIQGFVPLVVWLTFFSAKSTNLFDSTNSSYFWLITIVLWLGLYCWWLQWKPKRYLVNMMTLSAAEMQKQQLGEIQSITHFFSAVPKTLSGTLLIGSSDGIKSWLKHEFTHLAFFLVALLFILYWAKKIPENITALLITIYAFIFICFKGGILFQVSYRNLYRLWMSSDFTRIGVLNYVEKRYFLLFTTFVVPTALIFSLINIYFLGGLIGMFHGGYLLLICTLVVAFSFYLGLLVYIKSSASLVIHNWIGSIVSLFIVGLMVYLNILWGSNVSHQHADYVWFSGSLLMLVILTRGWVQSSWRKVNFYRAKN